ncbi:MAG: carboxypeptidase-like regulatory domain-containing protein [Planctomycetota bacterium]
MGKSLRAAGVLVLIALLVGAGYWLFRDPDSNEPTEVEDVSETPAAGAALPTLGSEEVLEGPAEEAIASDTETEPEAPPKDEEPKAGVRGRCIAAESGEPLAGCTVKFDGRPGNSAKMALHGPVDWEDPEPVVTGGDGVFFIEFEAVPPYQHTLDIQCEGRVPRTGRWGAFEPGEVDDLGDIELSFGAIVQGRVVDTEGQPAERVGVSVQNLPLPIRSGMAANNSRSGWSEADGRFEVRVAVPHGTWPVRISGRGFRAVSPDSITVEEGREVVELEVVVERMESIEGYVVDETGAPLESRVYLKTSAGGSFWTKKDSTFTVYGSGEPVGFGCEHPEGYEPFETEETYEWGSRGVRLTMQKALSFELTVVDAETKEPIEDYSVQCFAKRARWSSNREARLGGHHPGGVLTVDSVWRGDCLLRVIPKSREYWISDTIEFVSEDPGIEAMTVALQRMLPTSVRVELQDGTPISGSEVELILPTEQPITAEDRFIQEPHQNVDAFFDRNGGPRPQKMSSGRTDSNGIVGLLRVPTAEVFAVRALGPGHRPAALNGQLPPPPGTPLVITVARGAGLKGRLLGTAYREYEGDCSLRLISASADTAHQTIELESDGTFAVGGLVPGGYQLHLCTRLKYLMNGGASTSTITLSPKLGDVALEDGATREIELDSDIVAPGSILGAALLNGQGAEGGILTLSGRGAMDGFQCGQYMLAPDGSFEAKALPPGEYRAYLDFPAETQVRRYLSTQVIDLAAGSDRRETFEFDDRVLRVRLMDEKGELPLANTECRSWEDPFWTEQTSDENGWVIIDPAPPFAFTLQVDGHGKVGPLEMPAGQREARIEVRVPPKDQ